MKILIDTFLKMFATPVTTAGTIMSLVAMAFTVASFQAKSKKVLLIIQTMGSIIFFISYFFLGGVFGGIINSYYLLRNILFLVINSEKEPKKAKIACICLCSAYVVTYIIYTLITMPGLTQSLINVLPVFASIPGTIALTKTKPVEIRLWKLPDSFFWITYNSIILSLGGILCEVFNITSNTISMIRFREKKKPKQPPEEQKEQ
ncbi:MAG: YgjV family protein [Clostridia bacterium]|nr:YgjV family protein [Clostridia bacterium]